MYEIEEFIDEIDAMAYAFEAYCNMESIDDLIATEAKDSPAPNDKEVKIRKSFTKTMSSMIEAFVDMVKSVFGSAAPTKVIVMSKYKDDPGNLLLIMKQCLSGMSNASNAETFTEFYKKFVEAQEYYAKAADGIISEGSATSMKKEYMHSVSINGHLGFLKKLKAHTSDEYKVSKLFDNNNANEMEYYKKMTKCTNQYMASLSKIMKSGSVDIATNEEVEKHLGKLKKEASKAARNTDITEEKAARKIGKSYSKMDKAATALNDKLARRHLEVSGATEALIYIDEALESFLDNDIAEVDFDDEAEVNYVELAEALESLEEITELLDAIDDQEVIQTIAEEANVNESDVADRIEILQESATAVKEKLEDLADSVHMSKATARKLKGQLADIKSKDKLEAYLTANTVKDVLLLRPLSIASDIAALDLLHKDYNIHDSAAKERRIRDRLAQYKIQIKEEKARAKAKQAEEKRKLKEREKAEAAKEKIARERAKAKSK